MNFKKGNAPEIDPSKTDAEVALLFIEHAAKYAGRKEVQRLAILALLNLFSLRRPEYSLKLWRVAAALSPVFKDDPHVQSVAHVYGRDKSADEKELLEFAFGETELQLAEMTIEKIGLLLEFPEGRRHKMITLIIFASMIVNLEFGEKLRRATEAISGQPYVLVAETHNSPSQIRGGGIHILVGEDTIPHRDLEEVLKDLFIDPHTGIGGRNRDIRLSGPIDYGNEMRFGQRTSVVQIGGVTRKEGFGGSDRKPK